MQPRAGGRGHFRQRPDVGHDVVAGFLLQLRCPRHFFRCGLKVCAQLLQRCGGDGQAQLPFRAHEGQPQLSPKKNSAAGGKQLPHGT
ncbi:hypothetical protein HRbin09_00166 [bacterium HR09]|nr:hypothetical protein HRbin09_00166 [bacterium HR09]